MRKAPLCVLLVMAVLGTPGGLLHAGETVTKVTGYFNSEQENACSLISQFFFLTDCTYARTRAEVAGNKLPWMGPSIGSTYYERSGPAANPAAEPAASDQRIRPSLSGTLTIDDRGTPDPADDLVSGELVVGAAARSFVATISAAVGAPADRRPRAVISWSRITHTLEPTAVDAASANALGGIDYTIASKGFPERICLSGDPADCFPSARALKMTDGQDAASPWKAPASIGLTRDTAMDGNAGARTTAAMHDYACNDNVDGLTCPQQSSVTGRNSLVLWRNGVEAAPGERNVSEAPGFDNLLLSIETDAAGRIVKAAGYWTQEYTVGAGPDSFHLPEGHDNSWLGGYLELAGVEE